ncbi:MAG: hypothetical protein MO853_13710 [Candidatus Protistobacter heckmanni]|nr:hypothetical protein [Candidatus Protistobacter heckmanni]
MAFPVGGQAKNAFCATPVRIETSPLVCADPENGERPGCKPAPGCIAFAMVDEAFDSLRFYWNRDRGRLSWWLR